MKRGIVRFLGALGFVAGLTGGGGEVCADHSMDRVLNRPVTIAIARDYPPFTQINSEGRPAGMLVDLWRLWSERTGTPVNFVALDWADSLAAVRDQRAEIHSGLFWTAERSEWMVFSDPLYTVRSRLFARTDFSSPLTPSGLSGRTVAMLKGVAQAAFLAERYPDIRQIDYESPVEQIRAVLRGEADAMVGEELTVKALLAREGLIGELKSGAEPLFVNALFAGLDRRHAGLINSLNKGLAAIRFSELAEVEANWVPAPEDRQFGGTGTPPIFTAQERAWIAEHPVVRIGVDPAWPPFEYVDDEGRYQGLASDYMALISERTGLKFEVAKGMTWEQVVEAGKSRRIDAFALAAPTPDRESYMRFTRPYLSFPMVVVMRADAPVITGIDSLQGQPVAVARNYVSHEVLGRNHPELALVPVATAKEGLERVSDGRAGAYVGNLATISHLIRQFGLTNLKVAATTPYRFDLGMGVRDDWPVLLGILEKAFAGITQAEQDAVHARWVARLQYDHGVDKERLSYWTLRGLVVLIVILGGIFLWNWRLQREIQERRLVEAKLRALATTDPLTGIANRRHFYDLGGRELARMRRAGHPLSLIMIDIDHFKHINDRFGHITGDKALKQMVEACQPCLRNSDVFGRLGGEEFGVLLPDTPLHAAEQVAERLRQAAEETFLEVDGGRVRLTASLGVAQAMAPAETFDSLIRRADQSLYRAKDSGRNTVRSSPPCGAVPMPEVVTPEIKSNVQALPSRKPFI